MEYYDFHKMVKSALVGLEQTRGSTLDNIWSYVKANFHISDDTKTYRNIKEALISGVKEGLFQECVGRTSSRYTFNTKTKSSEKTQLGRISSAMKCQINSGKVKPVKRPEKMNLDIKSTNTDGLADIQTNERKESSASSHSKKKRKIQLESRPSATESKEILSVSRGSELPKRKLEYERSFTVKLPDDKFNYNIKSIDITPDGRILIVDRRIKMFNYEGEILATLKIALYNGPHAVAVISNEEAVCTVMPDHEIYILDIKDNNLAIQDTIRVIPRRWVGDICVRDDKLIVANVTNPLSVQLIDRQGSVYWSRNRDDQGLDLFRTQMRMTSIIEDGTSKVVTVDALYNRIVTLDGDTGGVVKVCKLFEKGGMAEACVTEDGKGVLFVANILRDEIHAWNFELTESKVILSKAQGLRENPSCLKYDTSNNKLIVSYYMGSIDARSVVDIFRLIH